MRARIDVHTYRRNIVDQGWVAGQYLTPQSRTTVLAFTAFLAGIPVAREDWLVDPQPSALPPPSAGEA